MCSAEVIRALQEVIPTDTTMPTVKIENLDPSFSRVIDEIKRINFEVVHVGQKRMKGLELPQVVSLIYPKELYARHALQQELGEENTGQFGSQPQINLELIGQLGLLCLRLEFLTSDRVFRSINSRPSDIPQPEEEEVESRILYADPAILLPPIPENASATHLILVLDMLSVRIESALTNVAVKQVALDHGLLNIIRGAMDFTTWKREEHI